MRLYRRILVSATAICVLGAVSMVTVPTSAQAAPARAASKGGGIATFAEQAGSPPTYIFPLFTSANSSPDDYQNTMQQMWLPVYWSGHPTNSKPSLNTKLSMADAPVFSNGGKTITMTFKHYVWSTGAPVTARDLVFFMNLLMNNKTKYALYSPGTWMTHVASYSAPSADTFVLNLNTVYNETYLIANALFFLTPIPQQAWDKTSTSGPVGTYDTTSAGAKAVYKYLNARSLSLSSWDTTPLWQVVDGPWHLQPNTGFQVTGKVVMIPNKKYSGPNKPKIAEFEELPFTSATAEYDALRSGTVDYGYIPATDLGSVGTLKASGYTVQPWYTSGVNYVSINYDNPKYSALVSQLYIRQAMERLIDQPEYIKKIFGGDAIPDYGPVPTVPVTKFLVKGEENPYPYSPSKAKKLLSSHGWSIHAGGTDVCTKPGTGAGECGKGISAGTKLAMTLMYPSGTPTFDNAIRVMNSAFSGAGIHLTLSQAPVPTAVDDAFACIGKPPATCPTSTPELDYFAPAVWTYLSGLPIGAQVFACGGSANAGYCNKQVDAEINAIVSQSNAASLKTMHKYEVYLSKQVPDLWFVRAAFQISVISTKLKGIPAQGSTLHIYPATWTLKS
jgi:peptide/nickel transport system substrate-binding protein